MQVLKDEVKQKIKSSAVLEFKEKGYEKASMRSIAKGAEMSVGNLYRYFNNKESLFSYIVIPVHKALMIKIEHDLEMNYIDVNFLEDINFITGLIASKKTYREELYILLAKSKGSQYENTKTQIIEIIEKSLCNYIATKINIHKKIVNEVTFSKTYAISQVEGICHILETSQDDSSFIENLIQYLELTFKSTIRHLISLRDETIKFRRIDYEKEIYNCCSSHFVDSSDNS